MPNRGEREDMMTDMTSYIEDRMKEGLEGIRAGLSQSEAT